MQYIPQWLHTLFKPQDAFDALMQIQGESYRKVKERHTQKITLEGNDYFIKKNYGIGWREMLKNLLQGRRPTLDAGVEWRAIKALESLGIATTPGVAYAVRGKNPITRQSFVLTRALENKMSLEDVVNTPEFNTRPLLKRDILTQVAHITKTIHDHGMNHRDLYICHFLMQLDKNGKVPLRCLEDLCLIDLHRMQMHKKLPERSRVKDLSALLFSSFDASLTQRDYFRFLKIYTGLPLKKALKQKRWKVVFARARALYKKENSSKPFVISWPVQKMLRAVPGRRWTFNSTWQGRPVVIKIFALKWQARRSLRNFKILQAKGILMPELLHITLDKTQRYTCFIFEEIPHTPLTVQARQAPLETLKLVMQVLAKQHQMGILKHKREMHLSNFIMVDEVIYTIDTDRFFFRHNPLSPDESVKNLALLIVQFFPEVKASVPEIYEFYCQQRGWQPSLRLSKKLQYEIKVYEASRKKQLLKKIFRTCSLLKAKKTFFETTIWLREVDTENFQIFMRHPEAALTGPEATVLERSNGVTWVKLIIDGKPYWVKRYAVKNPVTALLNLILFSPAEQSWRAGHLLQFLHIPTATPVALIEKRWGPFKREAYLVTEFLAGEKLSDLKQAQQARAKTQVLAQIARMHAEHITYGGLTTSDILWVKEQPVFISLDSVKIHNMPFLKKRAVAQDNMQFLQDMYNIPEVQ